jgi:hypothetical protein
MLVVRNTDGMRSSPSFSTMGRCAAIEIKFLTRGIAEI